MNMSSRVISASWRILLNGASPSRCPTSFFPKTWSYPVRKMLPEASPNLLFPEEGINLNDEMARIERELIEKALEEISRIKDEGCRPPQNQP